MKLCKELYPACIVATFFICIGLMSAELLSDCICEQCDDVQENVVDVRCRVYALGRIELVTMLDEMGYWAYEDQPLNELREELVALIEDTEQTWRLFMSSSRKESD